MELTKDTLQYLRLETFYIIQNNIYCMCYPLEVNFPAWKLSLDTNEIDITKPVTLKIKYNDEFIYYQVLLKHYSNDEIYGFIYEAVILEQESDRLKNELLEKISILSTKLQSWNNRKEERYEIGTCEENGKLICFKSLEQNIIVDNIHIPCIVNNLSFSGSKITTYEGNFQKDKKIWLELSFIAPIEQIHLHGIIRNCFMKKVNNEHIISVLSLEYEFSPMVYKERLAKYIKTIELKQVR